KKDSPVAPVWIQFPRLKLCFHNQGILKTLASMVGRYLTADQTTLIVTPRLCK
ncbi:hypothetical protein GIB67_019797, partial [Kingdonia uniflora]